MKPEILIPQAVDRHFLPNDFVLHTWEQLQPYYETLMHRPIESVEDLEHWLHDRDEMESVVNEDVAKRYIRMTCDTTDEAATQAYQTFISQIYPHIAPYVNVLNCKLIDSPFVEQLQSDAYKVMLRSIRTELSLFREENIPLFTELKALESDYSAIMGAMTIEHEGKELTLQQASQLLKEQDRQLRETIYLKINERKLQDCDRLNDLLSKMIALRHQVALNAGFENYRDYKFAELGRYDYTTKDCLDFHESIRNLVVPMNEKMSKEQKQLLGYSSLRPWDMQVDPTGKAPLKPFNTSDELLEKSIQAFTNIHPYFGACLQQMKNIGHFDLASRKGKAPGGYNYPLSETGIPFIFMNATHSFGDLTTMMHEGGHAVHSFLTQNLDLDAFKSTPSEVAEVASMAMELIAMEQFKLFFDSEEDLNRAKTEQLKRSISILPWIAVIDAFQHWLYTNPQHTAEQRNDYWVNLWKQYSSPSMDFSGLEQYFPIQWQGQLHIFEVPFYYIEYGIAQLAALAIWRNYQQNHDKGLEGYIEALKLGYTKTIPVIYETANIRFDFSENYLKDLIQFVNLQMSLVKQVKEA